MKNKLYFSNEKFKEKAMSSDLVTETNLTPEDAFFLLIEGVELKALDLYCQNIQEKNLPELSIQEIYETLQHPKNLTSEQKESFFDTALKTKKFGNFVVNPMPNIYINTSSWITHSLNVGITASVLATGLQNVEPKKAFVLGILHDIGRKFKTDMQHTIFGYEYLVNKGYTSEAKVCLTHSHIHGERCANNEPAVPGWSCENGVSTWDESVETDDLTKFLKTTTYNSYDSILNIADLMATDSAILPVYDRIQEIKSRRKIDPTNRKFFYAELINLLNEYLHSSIINEPYSPIYATNAQTEESLEKKLIQTSQAFYSYYQTLETDEYTPKKNLKN